MHAHTSFAHVYALRDYVDSDVYAIIVLVGPMPAHLLHTYMLCKIAHIYALQDYAGSDIYAVVVRAHLRGYAIKARISVWIRIQSED